MDYICARPKGACVYAHMFYGVHMTKRQSDNSYPLCHCPLPLCPSPLPSSLSLTVHLAIPHKTRASSTPSLEVGSAATTPLSKSSMSLLSEGWWHRRKFRAILHTEGGMC